VVDGSKEVDKGAAPAPAKAAGILVDGQDDDEVGSFVVVCRQFVVNLCYYAIACCYAILISYIDIVY
jgi:hypothetical protein